MIDFLSLTIDIFHTPFGATRKIERAGVPYQNVKQYTDKVDLYPDAAFIYVTSLDNGTRINIRGCPLKPLQGHNVFGADHVRGFGFQLICFILQELDISFTESQKDAWEKGCYMLRELHITYRLRLEAHTILEPLVLHILRNVPPELRPAWLKSGLGITLEAPHGQAGWMLYDKLNYLADKRRKEKKHLAALLNNEKKTSELWTLIAAEATGNIRAELRLCEKYLKEYNLDTAEAWRKGKPKEIFISELALLRLGAIPSMKSAITLMGKLKDKLLRIAYRLWLLGDDLSQYYSVSSLRTRRNLIKAAIGVDILSDKAPIKSPPVVLAEVFCEDNIMENFPDWNTKHPQVAYQGGDLTELRHATKRAA